MCVSLGLKMAEWTMLVYWKVRINVPVVVSQSLAVLLLYDVVSMRELLGLNRADLI